ncbi:unnamed protein product [Protopolystoma xenopodis]|uniref:Uncharacterized protein n=1 Tax=Protopolystoma xenopodis TaxID=117903 RepID=A0A3S5B729_9PLAT|nr:unnamed protein product [Protopolystoma xenopodis]
MENTISTGHKEHQRLSRKMDTERSEMAERIALTGHTKEWSAKERLASYRASSFKETLLTEDWTREESTRISRIVQGDMVIQQRHKRDDAWTNDNFLTTGRDIVKERIMRGKGKSKNANAVRAVEQEMCLNVPVWVHLWDMGLNFVVTMLPRSDDFRHMMDESLAHFHQSRVRLPRKQRQHESSSEANRQLIKRNPPSSSGGANLLISSRNTFTRNGSKLNNYVNYTPLEALGQTYRSISN